MRTAHITGTVAALMVGFALTACGDSGTAATPTTAQAMSTTAPSAMSMTAAAPAVSMTGTFAGLNGKKVAGSATVSGGSVALTGYSSDEGPDLHLYLTKGTTEADVKAGVRLGAIDYNAATQSFTLPAGVSADSYRYLVVHCDKALAVFGAAELTK